MSPHAGDTNFHPHKLCDDAGLSPFEQFNSSGSCVAPASVSKKVPPALVLGASSTTLPSPGLCALPVAEDTSPCIAVAYVADVSSAVPAADAVCHSLAATHRSTQPLAPNLPSSHHLADMAFDSNCSDQHRAGAADNTEVCAAERVRHVPRKVNMAEELSAPAASSTPADDYPSDHLAASAAPLMYVEETQRRSGGSSCLCCSASKCTALMQLYLQAAGTSKISAGSRT